MADQFDIQYLSNIRECTSVAGDGPRQSRWTDKSKLSLSFADARLRHTGYEQLSLNQRVQVRFLVHPPKNQTHKSVRKATGVKSGIP